MEAIAVAVIGLVAGALGSLVAPWAQWGVEKRREGLAHRRSLVKSWREGLSAWEASQVGTPLHQARPLSLITSEWYSSLAPNLDPDARKKIEDMSAIHLSTGPSRAHPASLVHGEIDRIEKEWGLAK